ncbi:hypothetical protein [Nocardia cyriacigeorgica]|uniref:hypothetical protein n=1 Tax=Nocardia cyriacigeorgica TaxID=135487 RepID=UPI0020D16579|nr:hypothetical protein [Nocardia cyriacigeorgica]
MVDGAYRLLDRVEAVVVDDQHDSLRHGGVGRLYFEDSSFGLARILRFGQLFRKRPVVGEIVQPEPAFIGDVILGTPQWFGVVARNRLHRHASVVLDPHVPVLDRNTSLGHLAPEIAFDRVDQTHLSEHRRRDHHAPAAGGLLVPHQPDALVQDLRALRREYLPRHQDRQRVADFVHIPMPAFDVPPQRNEHLVDLGELAIFGEHPSDDAVDDEPAQRPVHPCAPRVRHDAEQRVGDLLGALSQQVGGVDAEPRRRT